MGALLWYVRIERKMIRNNKWNYLTNLSHAGCLCQVNVYLEMCFNLLLMKI